MFDAKTFQIFSVEMFRKRFKGVIALENPILEIENVVFISESLGKKLPFLF